MNRNMIAVVVAAVLAAFGGGFLVAKGVDGAFGGHGATHGSGASPWSMFGHPRGANAPRAGVPRPEGFAIWQTRLDTSGAAPSACIQMSRELDPSKSYADFVMVAP